MKACKSWSFDVYLPANRHDPISVVSVVPFRTGFRIAWKGGQPVFAVSYREKGSSKPWTTLHTSESSISVDGLAEEKDYEFFVESAGKQSLVGFVRTGFVPGIPVNYIHPEDPKYAFSGQHPCTPCLLIHPDGYYLASMDVFDGGAPQNLTLIFRSDDRGKTWYHYSELFPCFWGTLFLHRGEVYMLSMSTEYGDLLIGKSSDGGKTWGMPTVIERGSCHRTLPGWHKGSMPVIEYSGRLWCGVDFGSHASGGHMNCLASVDADSDLLDASNWYVTDPLRYDPSWEGAVVGDNRGCIEGNAVVLPDGRIGNFLRYSTNKGTPSYGYAVLLTGDVSNPSKSLKFEKIVPFPGNLSKFDVKKDPVSGYYFSICSRITSKETPAMRNLLSLVCSKDLLHWELLQDLLDYRNEDHTKVGFQYVSFSFDGEDLIYLSRTAFNGAQNYHDNNFITFHRIENFRSLLPDRKA